MNLKQKCVCLFSAVCMLVSMYTPLAYANASVAQLGQEELPPPLLSSERPNEHVTRAELAAVLTRMFQLPLAGNTQPKHAFTDTNDHWVSKQGYLQAVVPKKWITGHVNNQFLPNKSVTVEQLLVSLLKGIGIAPLTATAIDMNSMQKLGVSKEAAPYIAAAIERQLIPEKLNSYQQPIRRDDASELVNYVQLKHIMSNTAIDIQASNSIKGETEFTFNVQNKSSLGCKLSFGYPIQYKVVIKDAAGHVVEDFSDRAYPAVIVENWFAAGEQRTFKEKVKLKPNEKYTVEFWFIPGEFTLVDKSEGLYQKKTIST
ncbi:BsuPI-related putative proteinase inhibitor [Paenibacillus sp. 481]|uniref:BsuPI-related putative proteinase inhibitor n=1 Tax=Paenibacillus sp. 481 TaxID=2835869 RepID=UPI001E2EFAA8|nr:BsuPI-related putative proteinase inhibitor [Paenibacillus sp. 481]UHA73856.1 S-layer homology domain-containing protein [Paenibacillus sp. 481]